MQALTVAIGGGAFTIPTEEIRRVAFGGPVRSIVDVDEEIVVAQPHNGDRLSDTWSRRYRSHHASGRWRRGTSRFSRSRSSRPSGHELRSMTAQRTVVIVAPDVITLCTAWGAEVAIAQGALAAVQSGGGVTPDVGTRTLAYGTAVRGTLSPQTATTLIDGGSAGDVYTFRCQAGDTVALFLTSIDFDAYLEFFSQDQADDHRLLASDNDSGSVRQPHRDRPSCGRGLRGVGGLPRRG